MSDEQSESQGDVGALRIRRIVGGLIGTILLGALGSGLWDLLFRPSLRETGGWIARMWQAADDVVFASAALDPRPIPDLLFILILIQVPLWFAMWAVMEVFFKPSLFKRLESRLEQHDSNRRRFIARLRWVVAGGALFFFVVYLLGRVGFSIANDSVVVWRVFHRNLAICGPFLSGDQEKEILSAFARMRTRSDFDEIRVQLDKAAQSKGLQLKWLQ